MFKVMPVTCIPGAMPEGIMEWLKNAYFHLSSSKFALLRDIWNRTSKLDYHYMKSCAVQRSSAPVMLTIPVNRFLGRWSAKQASPWAPKVSRIDRIGLTSLVLDIPLGGWELNVIHFLLLKRRMTLQPPILPPSHHRISELLLFVVIESERLQLCKRPMRFPPSGTLLGSLSPLLRNVLRKGRSQRLSIQ